jgi:hypothetical protein
MAEAQSPPTNPKLAIIAVCGAIGILTIFALGDVWAIVACLHLAPNIPALPELCGPEHIFRTSLEVGGMAIGLYGATRLIR